MTTRPKKRERVLPLACKATRGTSTRYLCVLCTEDKLGRKLTAKDFKRTAKVNCTDQKSALLRARMRGLKPATRLIETKFTP